MTDRIEVKSYYGSSGHGALLQVVKNMREIDREEILLATGRNPGVEIVESWNNSTLKWAVLKNGVAVALFGVDTVDRVIGLPWFVATDEIKSINSFIARHSKEYIGYMREGFDSLSNFVDSNNKGTLRWLQWCGFSILDPVTHGPYNHLFHQIRM